jgi:hypothetical protein
VEVGTPKSQKFVAAEERVFVVEKHYSVHLPVVLQSWKVLLEAATLQFYARFICFEGQIRPFHKGMNQLTIALLFFFRDVKQILLMTLGEREFSPSSVKSRKNEF